MKDLQYYWTERIERSTRFLKRMSGLQPTETSIQCPSKLQILYLGNEKQHISKNGSISNHQHIQLLTRECSILWNIAVQIYWLTTFLRCFLEMCVKRFLELLWPWDIRSGQVTKVFHKDIQSSMVCHYITLKKTCVKQCKNIPYCCIDTTKSRLDGLVLKQ